MTMKFWFANFLILLLFGIIFSDNSKPACSGGFSGSAQNENDKMQFSAKQKHGEKDHPDEDDQRFIIRDSVRLSEKHLKSWQEQDSIYIYIQDDIYLIAIIERYNIDVNKTISIRARFVNYPRGYMIMSSTNGITSGTIQIPEKNMSYRIKTSTEDKLIYIEEFVDKDVIEIDTVLIPPEGP